MDIETLKKEVARNLADNGDASRLFHGRGNCFQDFEHLNIDYYPPVVIIQIFKDDPSAVKLPEELASLFPEPQTLCWLLQERHLPRAPWTLLQGELPDQTVAQEGGLIYETRFMKNQNTGFFLDMKAGRQLAASLAPGRKVLNLFAYTCSFSVVAMAAGAESVVNMDLSKASLRTGKTNHINNGISNDQVSYMALDVLKSFGRMKRSGPFSLVIIDPPTQQKGAFEVEKDYARLVRRLPEFLEPGAHILACLNTPWKNWSFLKELFHQPFWRERGRIQRPDEFREKNPEQSLKILHLQYQPPKTL